MSRSAIMHSSTLLTEFTEIAEKFKSNYYTCSFGLEKESFGSILRHLGF
jgi:hypothetical protein